MLITANAINFDLLNNDDEFFLDCCKSNGNEFELNEESIEHWIKEGKLKKEYLRVIDTITTGLDTTADAGAGLTVQDYLNIMYSANDGYIFNCTKDNKDNFKQRGYKLEELLSQKFELNKHNYTSVNSFFVCKRLESHARQLNAFYVDLDCYNVIGSEDPFSSKDIITCREDILNIIDWLVNKKQLLPKPTLMIDSGRGYYLIWKFKDQPATALSRKYYKKVQGAIVELLQGLGADPQCVDVSRILRVPGTTNIKDNSKCSILEYNEDAFYDFKDLDFLLPELEKAEKRKTKKTIVTKSKNSNIASMKNGYTLHIARLQDLRTLCKLRNYQMQGLRELTLFLLRYWTSLVSTEEKALNDVLEFNKLFTEPLLEQEVIKATNCKDAVKLKKEQKENKLGFEGYNYKTETLIDIFKITTDEQKHLTNLINQNEKNRRRREKRRNKDGLTSKEQQKIDLINQIKDLKNNGLKNIEIAEKLGISKFTVSKYLKL